MDILIDWQPFETTFRGGKIQMMLRPLRTSAMLKLMPYMQRTNEKEESRIALTSMEIQQAGADIFTDHVKDITGLTVNNGQPVTGQILADESIFNALSMEIVARLFEITQLVDDSEKNSVKPSGSQQQNKRKA